MKNILLMMPVSADGFTLIIGTPADRPCGHSGTDRADYGRGLLAHQKNAQDPPLCVRGAGTGSRTFSPRIRMIAVAASARLCMICG